MYFFFFFFKQKTAYEMRISDWSSDVCSSDLFALAVVILFHHEARRQLGDVGTDDALERARAQDNVAGGLVADVHAGKQIGVAAIEGGGGDEHGIHVKQQDRKSDVEGQSVYVRVDLGGRRINKNNKHHNNLQQT